MDAQTFIAAIRKMSALPEAMRSHLFEIANDITDEERAQALALLTPLYGSIAKDQEDLGKELEEGLQTLATVKKNLRTDRNAAQEQKEKKDAEHILDDSSVSHTS